MLFSELLLDLLLLLDSLPKGPFISLIQGKNASEFSGSLEIYIVKIDFQEQICMKIAKVYNVTQKVHLNMEQQGTELFCWECISQFINI